MVSRHTRWCGTALVVVAALGLTSCSLISSAQHLLGGGNAKSETSAPEQGGAAPSEPLIAPPVGDPGGWLHAGYSRGIEQDWTTKDRICGVGGSSKIVITSGFDERKMPYVAGIDLQTGAQLWKIPATRCEPRATSGDVALIARMTKRASGATFAAERIDVRTGKPASTTKMPADLDIVRLYGEDAERIYFAIAAASGNQVAAMDHAGKLAWTVPFSEGAASFDCAVLTGALGCSSNGVSNRVLDVKTGKTKFTLPGSVDNPAWASDGYATPIGGDSKLTTFDLAGAESGGPQVAAWPLVPGAGSRLRVGLEAGSVRGGAIGFDAKGGQTLTLSRNSVELRVTRTGAPLPEASVFSVFLGSSADGEVFAYQSAPGEEIILATAEGADVARIAAGFSGDGSFAGQSIVSGGLIVSEREQGSSVAIPKGGLS